MQHVFSRSVPSYSRSSRQISQLKAEKGTKDMMSASNIRSLTRQGDTGIITFHTPRQSCWAAKARKFFLIPQTFQFEFCSFLHWCGAGYSRGYEEFWSGAEGLCSVLNSFRDKTLPPSTTASGGAHRAMELGQVLLWKGRQEVRTRQGFGHPFRECLLAQPGSG